MTIQNKSHPTLKDTQNWAKILHADQRDKLGKPYTGHIERVAAHLKLSFANFTDDQLHAAYLHDAMEDCGTTKSDLFERGYKYTIVKTIELVTKPREKMFNSDYEEWIRSIIASQNIDAIRVKFSDMSDNFNEERMSQLEVEERIKLQKKYLGAYSLLTQALNMKGELQYISS